jgi:ribosome-associated protein
MTNPLRKTRITALPALDASGASPQPTSPTSLSANEQESRRLAVIIATAAADRKGADITLLKVSDVSYLADYFVVVTGFSNVQVRAIANSIEEKVETEWEGRLPLRVEGQSEGSWILMDYGDVIVHVFLPNEREFYDLEAFWGHAEQIPFSLTHSSSLST